MQQKKILILPGDGIGSEVVNQVKKIIDFFNSENKTNFLIEEADIGGIAYDKTGSPFPDETLHKAKAADAILLGAVGGPKWENLPYEKRPERGLLGIRKELGLFANLRPAIVFDSLVDSSTLKSEVVKGLDIMIVRELTGGIYFGKPRGVTVNKDGGRSGVNSMTYSDFEITRIAEVAFDLARKRSGKLCSVDKANVLEVTELWREEVIKVGKVKYSDVELSHMYVDNACMQLIRNPKQFDVIVTTNMFGDILSDAAAMLTGSLGMLPSASLGQEIDGKRPALYEPVHGSAPDIAGRDVANPIATISSFAMMLRYSFDLPKLAEDIDLAITSVLKKGYRTADIANANIDKKIVGCNEMGDLIRDYLGDNLGNNLVVK